MKSSRKLIQQIFEVQKHSNLPFSCSHITQTESGINTQKSLTSPNIQKSGGMKTVEEILTLIDKLSILKIGNTSRVWSES